MVECGPMGASTVNLGLPGVPATRAKYCFCIVFSLHAQV